MLQQYLPFTVLKQFNYHIIYVVLIAKLQQYLPFTVLKHWIPFLPSIRPIHWLQQDLLFTICRERCEIIEEKSDNGCAALYLDWEKRDWNIWQNNFAVCVVYQLNNTKSPEWIILIYSGFLYLSFIEYVYSYLFNIFKL